MPELNEGQTLNPDAEQGDAQSRTKQDTELIQSILATQLSETEAYKALQRPMSRLANENLEMKRQLDSAKFDRDRLEAMLRETRTVVEWQSEQVVGNLSPDEKDAAVKSLRERTDQAKKDARLEALEAESKNRGNPQPHTDFSQPEIQSAFEKIERETFHELKAVLRNSGIDPDLKGLDYGVSSQPFVARLKVLSASIEKAKKEATETEAESLRRKDGVNTRTGTGPADGYVRPKNRDDALAQAADILRRGLTKK